MIILKRFWAELKNPKLKCNRIGHKLYKITQRIRTDGNNKYSACDYKQVLMQCRRCNKKPDEASRTYITGFNSCTMPESYWENIRKNGYHVMEVISIERIL